MEILKESIQSVIEKDRIGSPVFLRCVLNIVDNVGSLLQPTSEMVSFSNGTIPSQVKSVYAQGAVDGLQVTVMLQYVGGQMAILSINRVETETAIDIMLVGNRGVIYHETPIGKHYLSATPPEFGKVGDYCEEIARSLSTGQPIAVEG